MKQADTEHKRGDGLVATSTEKARLSGFRLLLARITWAAGVTLLVVLFLAMLPAYYRLLQTVCTGATCGLVQPNQDAVQSLHKLGLSLEAYATFIFALTLASVLLCIADSVVIFWRRSDDWMALLVALGVVALGILYVTYTLQKSHSALQVLAIVLNILSNGIFFLVCSLFPDGRFVPRWTRWLLPCWMGSGVGFLLLRDVPWMYPVYNVVWLATVILLVVALFYRYRSASSPMQRQQTKWVIYGGSVAGIIVVGLTVPLYLFPSLGQAGSFYQLVIAPVYIFNVLLVPLSLGLAMLRFRLYDIDVLINRTLVYGSLTVLLALIYFVCVIVLQTFVRELTGRVGQFPLIIVGSTLAIAALFQPLRGRIQRIIDWRFYRRKYDAAKTLEAFSATFRQEVDLSQLQEQLIAVVRETMQPSHVSLWLRQSDSKLSRTNRIPPRQPSQ